MLLIILIWIVIGFMSGFINNKLWEKSYTVKEAFGYTIIAPVSFIVMVVTAVLFLVTADFWEREIFQTMEVSDE